MQSVIFHMHVLPDWFPLLQKVLQAFFIVLSYNNQTFCKMSRDKIEFMGIKHTTFDVASTILYCLRFCISRKFICDLFILYLIYAALHATEKHPEKKLQYLQKTLLFCNSNHSKMYNIHTIPI